MILNSDIASLSIRQRRWLEQRLAERREFTPASARQIPAAPAAQSYPLSFAQERLWFVDQLESGSAFYNIVSAVQLEGRVERAALERAVTALASRQDVLRTVFTEHGGEPVQVLTSTAATRLPVVDLAALPRQLRESETRRILVREAPRPFDLSRGPLYRCHLVRLGREHWVMAWVVHHIVSDLWSLGVLWRELAATYEAYSKGTRPRLPELTIRYRDYAVWQRDRSTHEAMEAQLAHWRRQLEGATSFLALPTDRPRPAVQTYRGSHRAFDLPIELRQGLEALGKVEQCTLFMLILAAYQVLLGHLAGQDDIVVSAPLGGREQPECQHLVGFFINTLLFRTDLSGDPTWRDLLARVRRLVLASYTHQDVSLERLVREMAPKRELAYNPFFQAGLNFVEEELMPSVKLSGLAFETFEADSGTVQHEMNLIVARTPRGLSGRLQYKTDLFDEDTIVLVVDQFREVIKHAVAHPDGRLSEIHGRLEEVRSSRRAAANRRLRQRFSQTFKAKRRRAGLVAAGG